MGIKLPDFAAVGFDDPASVGRLPQYPNDDPGAAGAAAMGKGLQAVGGAAIDLGQLQEYKRQKLNESTATLDLFTRLVPLQTKIAQETDTDKIAEYRQEIDGLLPTSGQAIDDNYHRQAWMANHAKTILEANAHADARTTLLYRNKSLASDNDLIDRVIKTAVSDDDPQAFAIAQQGIAGHLDWQEKNGNLLPEQRYLKNKEANKQLVEGRALYLLGQGKADEAAALMKEHGSLLDPITQGNFQLRVEHAKEKQGNKAYGDDVWGGSDKGYAGNLGGGLRAGGALRGTGEGHVAPKTERIAFARDYAISRDVNPDALVATMAGEGLHRYVGDGGTSFGDLQLHVGGGMGDQALASGINIRDPNTWKEQIKFGVDQMAENKDKGAEWYAGQWHGAPRWAAQNFNRPGRGAPAEQFAADAAQPTGAGANGIVPVGATASVPAGPAAFDANVWAAKNQTAIGRDDKGNLVPLDKAGNFVYDAPGFVYSKPPSSGRIDETTNPALAAEINAAPAAGDPIPLDQAPAFAALPDIDAKIQRIQDDLAAGRITQDRANAAEADVRRRYSHVQSAQANARAEVTKRLTNGAAMLADGRDFEYDPAEVRHFFPKERADEILQTLQDSKDAGQITVGIRTASPADIASQRQQLAAGLDDPKATDYARRRKLLTAFDAVVKEREKLLTDPKTGDPAGYVAQFNPAIAAKYAAVDPAKPETFAGYATATLAEQERLGVPAEVRSVLPAGQAAALAAKISGIDPAKQDPAAALSAMARAYGAGTANDYWPHVFGDLVKANLPGTYQVLATMDRPEQTVAAADLSRAIGLIAEKGGMSALKKAVPDATQKAIDKSLDDSLADFRGSVGMQSGGARLYATVRDAAQSLAYYYGFRGQGDSEAVQSAVDGIINAKYDFGTIGAGQVRVPKGSLGQVERAADVVKSGVGTDQLGDIPGNPILSPEQRKEVWLGAIQRGGWANNENDSGLVLMGHFRNGSYGAVRRADGSRIEMKFSDAPALAAAAPTPFPANPEDIGARPGQR